MDGNQPNSLVCITTRELFPKKSLRTDDKSLQVLFPELSGESVEFLAATSDATLALSNFRLFINFKDSFLNIPLRLIESVEVRDLFILQIYCKDARSFRKFEAVVNSLSCCLTLSQEYLSYDFLIRMIVFDSNEQSAEWLHRLSSRISPLRRIEELFAFAFYAWCMDLKPGCIALNGAPDVVPQYSFLNEMHRMGFETDQVESPWRITDVNSNYEMCRTYPKLHIVPTKMTDSDLERVASFRCSGRFPSVVWRHMTNGTVIARCSQPEVGWFGWRNAEDETLLKAIGEACAKDSNPAMKATQNGNGIHMNGIEGGPTMNGDLDCHEEESVTPKAKQVLIVDARSYTAALANRGKGGGFEYTEYYPNCEIMFMNLANIHSIRKSFHSLRALCSGSQDLPNWWSSLEKTNWLQHMSLVIKAAATVVHSIHNDSRPVVVHCSDGWDRTTQIVTLAELLLDPYYRSIEGFKVLIDREWLEFGHRFADRCGHGYDTDENERCPVFLQWLDCVHQLLRQFPCSFEFNESFLVKLVQHTYSCLFGTFLCNSEYERHKEKDNVKSRTLSVWSFLIPKKKEFRNLLYTTSGEQVLEPSCHVRSLQLWSSVFLAYPTPFADYGEIANNVESENSAYTSPTAPRFSFNYSDTNLELRESHLANVNSSKSDGDLVACARNGSCKNCYNNCTENHVHRHLGNINKDATDYRNGVCCRCRNLVVHKNGSVSNGIRNSGISASVPDSESSKSLYYSADSSTASVVSCTESTLDEMNSSMSSSTATVILDRSETESDTLTDNGECAASDEFVNGEGVVGDDQRGVSTKLDCSSNEDLSPQNKETKTIENTVDSENSSEIPRTSDEADNADNSEDLEPRDLFNTDNSTDPRASTTEISTQTSISRQASTSASTQNSASLGTLKLSSSSVFSRYLDGDGLTSIADPLQDRLRQIEMAYQAQLETLYCQVIEERRKRLSGNTDTGLPGRASDLADEVCSLPDSSLSGDHPPLSCGSADESSWIQVDDGEVDPIRWVPDHAATNCANCDTGFWIANRKHHCRNCGQVFCGTCSDHKLPVPNEQLYDPVRVCVSCFGKLVSMEERENGGRRRYLEVNSVG